MKTEEVKNKYRACGLATQVVAMPSPEGNRIAGRTGVSAGLVGLEVSSDTFVRSYWCSAQERPSDWRAG